MPQEIEVWYILPAIRREFTKILIKEHKLSQKKVAELLGVTKAAVSQYKSSKRAKEIRFNEKILSEIKKSAEKIMKNKSNFMKETQRILTVVRKEMVLCEVHRAYNKHISATCKDCFFGG